MYLQISLEVYPYNVINNILLLFHKINYHYILFGLNFKNLCFNNINLHQVLSDILKDYFNCINKDVYFSLLKFNFQINIKNFYNFLNYNLLTLNLQNIFFM